MGTRVESTPSKLSLLPPGLQVRMLGPLSIARNGIALELPPSRKVRALFGYLAVSHRAVGRGRLCELLWDVPNDPRGELRWCLSKLRGALDEPGRRRVIASGDMVSIDLCGGSVDAADIAGAAEKGMNTLGPDELEALSKLWVGEFLEGLEVDRSPEFDSWLVAQRRRFRGCHAAVLEHLVASLAGDFDRALPHLESWVEVAPFDARAQVALLGALAARGRIGDCEEHLAAAARFFEAEDLDFGPVHEAWRAIKAGRTRDVRLVEPAPVSAAALPVTGSASDAPISPHRASLVVMPFVEQAKNGGARGGLADGLTHDIITRLAKLRSLFIIARGSAFALADRGIGPEEAGGD